MRETTLKVLYMFCQTLEDRGRSWSMRLWGQCTSPFTWKFSYYLTLLKCKKYAGIKKFQNKLLKIRVQKLCESENYASKYGIYGKTRSSSSSSSSPALQPWSSLGLLKNVLPLVPISCLILPAPDTHGLQIPLNTVQSSGLGSSHFPLSFRICWGDRPTLYWIIWIHPGHVTRPS